ncbi:MAG: HAMP domain-containing histidine kinase [Candidatus Aminicenantes bacterium]|nr:HAMP domain-containing histidine kinase [Candidatus Aminicenantes bacterium]
MNKINGFHNLSVRLNQDKNKDEISSLVSNTNKMLANLDNEQKKRKTMENKMVMNEKLASIGRLSSNIAHEITNPLLAICSCMEVLKSHLPSDLKNVKEAFDISEAELKHIQNIISGLHSFHKMDKDEFVVVSLKEVLESSLKALVWTNKLQSIELQKDINKEVRVLGSFVLLKQVFVNLVMNASEAMGDGGGCIRLEIRTSRESETVEVHIFDDGPGIPEKIRNSLFEPFVTSKKEGTGLGLFISHQIINQHQGELVYDTEYESGCHFYVSLSKLEDQIIAD